MENDKEMLAPFIEVISRSFRPTACEKEATHWFTSAEILVAVQGINPSLEVTVDQVHDMMSAAGYSYGIRPGSQSITFQWMLVAL